jgi:hypothetical protein
MGEEYNAVSVIGKFSQANKHVNRKSSGKSVYNFIIVSFPDAWKY